ncbi:MAG: beta-lactamase induction signal transducer [Alphaproteobacteria bacterium]|nr:beta-lactamase induction signal transducer [Alphaproteobacteria bacterium]
MPDAASNNTVKTPDWFSRAIAVLGQRKTVVMLAFGFSAGLPYALLVGTINAWFGEAKVDLATIGVLSWIGLAYAFKFLWSPAVNAPPPFPFAYLGRRRGWILLCQSVIALSVLVISTLEPTTGLGLMALAAAVAALASATQDMSIDTWRIEVADKETPIDLLSAVYQFGYRIAAFIGGAGALFLADFTNWNFTFAVGGVVMALAVVGTIGAPEPAVVAAQTDDTKRVGETAERLRLYAVAAIMLSWAWAGYELISFMILAVISDTPPDAKAFTATYGPLIVIATVIFPCALAAWIGLRRLGPEGAAPVALPRFVAATTDRLYAAIVEPFVELMTRLGWSSILILVLILSYRLTDTIWGPFAYPFYLGELAYTKSEVAFASKTFGVGMLISGIALAAWSLLRLGRMPSLMIGAVTAAATNLLYADLANGSPFIDGFMSVTGLSWLSGVLSVDARMMRLLVAIAGENIAGGFAGAVFVAYLSALASRLHGAVQFAVFSSLTMLIGTLGRGALGSMIESEGYAAVFVFTVWLGVIAVVVCAIEWARQSMTPRPD